VISADSLRVILAIQNYVDNKIFT
jgi:hypothetical protein